jgi:hypothetical protein
LVTNGPFTLPPLSMNITSRCCSEIKRGSSRTTETYSVPQD